MSSKSSKGPDPRKPVTVTLDEPVKQGDGPAITELVVRPAKAKYLRDFPARDQSVGDLMKVAALMCGKSDIVIDELSIGDWRKVEAVVSDFLDDSQTAGSD